MDSTSCGITQIFVIPRRAARRGISLVLRLSQREIPRFSRNDKINHFFFSLSSQAGLLAEGLIEFTVLRQTVVEVSFPAELP
jgi:hypothetical protein